MNSISTAHESAILDLVSHDVDPRRAFAAGTLVRIRRGSYYPTEAWIALDDAERFRLAIAAHAWANPQSVFCAETSLFLHGIPVVKVPKSIDLATTSTTRLGIAASTFEVRGTTGLAERARTLAPPQVRRHLHSSVTPEAVGGYLVVPMVEALVETLTHAKFARALTVADGVLRLNPAIPLLDRKPVMEAIGALKYATHRRRAEAIAALARPGAESPGESVSRALMLLFGFPHPILQVEYTDAQGFIGRTDFTWPTPPDAPPTPTGKDRVGEFDGWVKYFNAVLNDGTDPQTVIKREKRRENRILAVGHPMLRWTWADLERPDRLRSLLIEGGLRPSRRLAVAL